MEFNYPGHLLTLRAIKVQKPQLIPQGQLPKAFKTAPHLCMLQTIPKLDSQTVTPEAEQGILLVLHPVMTAN